MGAEVHAGVDKGVQTVGAVLQNVVGAPANNDAGTLVCQIPNDVMLDGPQKVSGGHAAHDTRDAPAQKGEGKVGLAGGKLPLLFNVLGVKAALQSHLFDQFLVVVWDAKALGHRLADGASAAAKLPTDGDDTFLHNRLTSFAGRETANDLTILYNIQTDFACVFAAAVKRKSGWTKGLRCDKIPATSFDPHSSKLGETQVRSGGKKMPRRSLNNKMEVFLCANLPPET